MQYLTLFNRRLHRRAALDVAGMGGLSALLAAACGGSDSSGSGTSSQGKSTAIANAVRVPVVEQEKPQRGGTLTLSLQAQMGNLHPKQVGGSTLTLRHTYDRLVNSMIAS